jgi:hypothetical protein
MFYPSEVLFRNHSNDTPGGTHNQTIGWDDFARGYQRTCTNDAIGSNQTIVQENASHTNNAVALNPTPVKNSTVTNGCAGTNMGLRQRAGVMGYGTILNIGVFTNGNQTLISTKNYTRPNTHTRCNSDFADDRCIRVDPSSVINLGMKFTIRFEHTFSLKAVLKEHIAHRIHVNQQASLDNQRRIPQPRTDLVATREVVGRSNLKAPN